MKRNVFYKVIVMMVLSLSIGLGSKTVQATSDHSLSDGTYTAGEEISEGLTKFSIPEGAAVISVSRGNNDIIYETLSDEEYSSKRFTISLKAGDKIDITLYDGAHNIEVQQIPKLDMKSISAGFYEVGTDIPAGTYTLDIDRPGDGYDMAYIDVFDGQYNEMDSFSLYYDDDPFAYNLSAGEKVYISSLIGTMSFKEKILVPKSIALSKSSLSLMVNRTAQLTATISPSSAINKSVSWTTSKPEIATVDAKGNVKARKAGSTTITATANGDPSIKKNMQVTVTDIVPTSLKLSKSTLYIANNQTVKVTATIAPSDAANKTILWKSSNTKVAKVDSKGNIKGIVNGSATITATAKDNAKVYKTVAVKVSTKTVKVNKTSLSITAGKTGTLTASVSPSDSVDKTIKWKSASTKIATVDSKGKVTGKAKGTTTVTATVKGAKDFKVKVTVNAPIMAKSVKLNKTSATISKGKTLTLSATVSPSHTTNKTVKWKSSNTKIAKVDSKGKVTAIGVGTAKITATTINGKASSTTIHVPYSKSLSAGKWKAGKDLPAGRYKITTKSGSGNLFIALNANDRYVNEILSSEDDGFGVTVVTTDIKSGDSIEISGLDRVQFTKVSNVKSNTLHAGYWTVGKDIAAGRYKITTSSSSGNLFIYRGQNLLVNEILSNERDDYSVTSVTTTLKTGDRINISGLNKVSFSKR
ncbi:Ig domain-containing protein [Bacillus sp. SD075]|uniref:Ig-like domain-containing protein n=1 Tax=Bacillus sp. SD075 TaxID=2781732 RepID=UPI001A97796B|nr:Ig-like domain-containing protein [Bacillus sp. SD075]MBO0998041.1 Ig domain-containing protein [Bacillus sp. SD075]